jgi:hypothetical protein
LAKQTQMSFWPNEPNCHFGRTKAASTNQQLYKMTAGSVSLFPACSLQGMVQLTRVGCIERSRSCKATGSQTCWWSRRPIRTRRPSISRGASPSYRAGLRWCACCAVERTALAAFDAVFMRQPCSFESHPRILGTKLAPLLRYLRSHFATVAWSSFAPARRFWLRLSRPTQSLMTPA